MRQVFRKIPVYTGDVSGVCSALFELGGMVVMHDPSGCNSTYNTHDEIRWYDHDSLIFLSGLDEMDAIMGSDDRLIHDIAEAARIYSPEFIAVANSPIPYITGMDFEAVCRAVEQETGIPSFYISTNGMHDYIHGAGLALLRIAERFTAPGRQETEQDPGLSASAEFMKSMKPMKAHRITCNLLGVTPLDFTNPSTLPSLYSKFSEAGADILSCWAMACRPGNEDKCNVEEDDLNSGEDNPLREEVRLNIWEDDQLRNEDSRPVDGNLEATVNSRHSLLEQISVSSQADVNILLSSVGFPAAEYMYKKYGIPFVAGIPARGVEKLFFEAVRRAVQTGQSQYPFRQRTEITGCRMSAEMGFAETSAEKKEESVYCFIGEPVIMSSLAAQTAALTGSRTYVFGATEGAAAFLGDTDSPLGGEEEIQAALEHLMENGCALKVVADPCYGDVLPEGCGLIRLPHLAFSGRIFLDEIPDLMSMDIAGLGAETRKKSDTTNVIPGNEGLSVKTRKNQDRLY